MRSFDTSREKFRFEFKSVLGLKWHADDADASQRRFSQIYLSNTQEQEMNYLL